MLIVAAWVGWGAPALLMGAPQPARQAPAMTGEAAQASRPLPGSTAPAQIQQPSTPARTDPAAPPASPSQVWLAAASLVAAPIILVVLWLLDLIRPGSPRRAGVRDVSGHPWPVWLMGAVLVFLGAPVGGQIAALLAGLSPGEDSLRAQALLAVGSYSLAVLVAVLLLRALASPRRAGGDTARADGLSVGAGDLVRGVLAFVPAYPLVVAASAGAVRLHVLLTDQTPERIAHRSLEAIAAGSADPWAWVVAGAAILGAPVVEETIYRVFLTAMLLRAGCGPWPAILACSTLFAVSHYGSVPWYAMVPLAVLGVAMGIAYERTKRLGVPILMHATFNALNVAVAVWLA